MEKKTIGTFIAALRKSSGLTQKQLAEKLNVSDKAVSRWERDECAPDLSLIPVIAEIFGITSDELIRGQRNNPAQPQPEMSEKRNKKQLQHLLKDVKTKYLIRSTVSIGIGIAGLMAAMICNFGFNRAYIGFGVALVFILAAVICQTIFTILAFSSVDDDEFAGKALSEVKKKLAQNAFSVFSVFLILFASVLPLVLYPWDTYQGLSIDSWLLYGLLYAGLAAVPVMIVHWLFPHLLTKKGFDIQKTELKINRQKIRWSCICAVLLLVTFFGWVLFMNLVPSTLFCHGTVFDNWNDFKTYMETPSDEVSLFPTESMDDTFFNKDYVYAKDGTTILCEYYHMNWTVSTIEYGDSDTLLPVTVYNSGEIGQGYQLRNVISSVFLIPAALTILLCIRQYRKKKAQITETSGPD